MPFLPLAPKSLKECFFSFSYRSCDYSIVNNPKLLPNMHILQPKHTKLKREDIDKLINEFNINISQLPRINKKDAALPEGCKEGDVIKIERKDEHEIVIYYRVVI